MVDIIPFIIPFMELIQEISWIGLIEIIFGLFGKSPITMGEGGSSISHTLFMQGSNDPLGSSSEGPSPLWGGGRKRQRKKV